MTNLLEETVRHLNNIGKNELDISFIGTKTHGCSWDEFKILANKEYDSGYGGHEVNDGMKIIFSDGSWLERAEYDGLEWWEYKRTPKIPQSPKKITNIFTGWEDME